MADIDFDELDRAVNSLMGNLKANDDPAPKSQEKVLKIESTLPPEPPKQEPAKESAEKEDEPKAVPSEPPRRVAVPPRRAGGRFMDVVHPAGDMRSKTPASPAVTPPKPSVSVKTDVETAESTEKADEPASEEPLTTPFLPDANEKVQKRPLGGKPDDESAVDDVLPETAEPEENEAGPEVEEITPINAEFSKESKIDEEEEKGQDQRVLDPTDFQKISPEEKALQLIESAETEAAGPETDDSVLAVESADTGQLRGSDDNESSAKSEKSGAIFDTEAYHQPFGVQKQKSGWSTIAIIVLVIAVCIGSAVAAFLFLGGFK